MKSLLVYIASVAVMFHMTFGCSMHHGLGANSCAHQHATVCDHDSHEHDADYDCDDHQHHDQWPDSDSPYDADDKSHIPSHLGCFDDSCNATQFVQFRFQALDFSVPYLGGVDTLALIENQSKAGLDVVPFPDWPHTGTGVRAHLLLGVQIL